MKNALLIDRCIDVSKLAFELQRQPELWNQHRERTAATDSPHRDADDIWIRYNDKTPYVENMDGFNDPHFPVWYPAYYALPSLKPIISLLMGAVDGEHLGGILIWRVKPGDKIHQHIDTGWHVDFYDKYNVCIQGKDKTAFVWPEAGEMMPGQTGQVYHFANSEIHTVINESDEDFIMLCVCIRTHHYEARYGR